VNDRAAVMNASASWSMALQGLRVCRKVRRRGGASRAVRKSIWCSDESTCPSFSTSERPSKAFRSPEVAEAREDVGGDKTGGFRLYALSSTKRKASMKRAPAKAIST
jgi:hypothetical protein